MLLIYKFKDMLRYLNEIRLISQPTKLFLHVRLMIGMNETYIKEMLTEDNAFECRSHSSVT